MPSGSPGSWLVPCYSPSLPSEIGSASGSTRHDYWVGGGRRKKGRGERRGERKREKEQGEGRERGRRKRRGWERGMKEKGKVEKRKR